MKKIKLILLSFLCVTSLCAQNVAPSEEDMAKGKEINGIKKAGEAFYSDVYVEAATESEALTEAEQKSMDLLKAHTIEIFGKRMGMEKKDVQEIWAEIEKRCKHVVVKRGDLYRVFKYVMKAQVDPDYEPEPTPEPKPAPKPTPEPKPLPADATVVVADTMVVTPPAPAPVLVASVTLNKAKLELMEGESDALVATVSPADADNKTISWSCDNPDVASVGQSGEVVALKEGVAVITVTTEDGGKKAVCDVAVKSKKIPVQVEVPVLCQKLIAAGSWNAMGKILKKEKARNKLMYGNSDQMQRHDRCYIVVAKLSGELVAVLDKGESDRVNFITMQMDHFKNYKGQDYKIVFVQEY